MSNYEKPILTDKGLDILTKINLGDGKNGPLKLTKMAIGSGMLPPNKKPEELTDLVEKIKDINIINFETTGLGLSDVTGEINNIGITQETPIFEIGVYAEDPETKQDVLYTYTYTRNSPTVLYQPVSTLYFGEFTVKTIISRDGKTVVNVVKPEKAVNIGYDNSATGLMAENMQDAIDEILLMHSLDFTIEHGLGLYPKATVLEVEGGYGMQGYGEASYGGGVLRELQSKAVYEDRNRMRVSVLKDLKGTPEVVRLGVDEFFLIYPDTSLLIMLSYRQSCLGDTTTIDDLFNALSGYTASDAEVAALLP